jgi:hypothetical protein
MLQSSNWLLAEADAQRYSISSALWVDCGAQVHTVGYAAWTSWQRQGKFTLKSFNIEVHRPSNRECPPPGAAGSSTKMFDLHVRRSLQAGAKIWEV